MRDKINERRLKRIVEIINSFSCTQPLHLFLKEYFRKNHVMGSTDRRIALSAIYNYYRTGNALLNKTIEEKIAISSFICQSYTSPFLDYLLRNYSFFPLDEITFPLERKMEVVSLKDPQFTPENIFPFKPYVTSKINFNQFVKSLLIQPKVWIRVRQKFIDKVKAELTEKKINFEEITNMPLTLGFENNVPLQQLKSFENGFFEIQDISSQKIGIFFKAEEIEHWWDCCAGSGGKSLMLKDKFPGINLLATDIRENILQNLEKRFKRAGIKNFTTAVVDLEKDNLNMDIKFDGIICDVPCTGSGTWGRNPENIFCFKEEQIAFYSERQKKIILKAAKNLKKGGSLIYITCSVFKEENEDLIEFIQKNSDLKLKEMELIDGTGLRADSLFIGLLTS